MKINLNIFIIVIIICLSSIVISQDVNSKTVVFYDFTPQTNPDFEIPNPNQVIEGLVKPRLGADRKPVYCCGDSPAPNQVAGQFVINNQTTFNQWFRNTPGVNRVIKLPLVLTKKNSTEDARIYYYKNDAFFPLDGKGFEDPNDKLYPTQTAYKDANKNRHNYHFCMELHSSFTYLGGEVFTFIGDDDVWVYINNEMVVDLGAPHTKQTGKVNLDKLGLVKGNAYNFDFFYCERHSVDSHILIETSILLDCRYTDYCGICEGDGSSCCTAETCNDNNACTEDKCPPPNTPRDGRAIKDMCINTPKVCKSSPCFEYSCNTATGQCEKDDAKYCEADKNCITYVCDEAKGGCYPKNIDCNSPDYPPTCWSNTCTNGTCEHNPINCDDGNACTVDSCDAKSGCIHKPIVCPSDNDHCTSDVCVANGKNYVCQHNKIPNCVQCKNNNTCTFSDKCYPAECDPTGKTDCITKNITALYCNDNNPCTIDTCDSTTGNCTFTSICKPKDGCSIPFCSSKTNKCENIDPCDDHSNCTIDECTLVNGKYQCSHRPNPCDDGNPCTEDSCDLSKGGCQNIPIKCPDTVCGVGVCGKNGCTVSPRPCPTDIFCLVGKCDNIAGGCIYYDKKCVPDNPNCATGVCSNSTKECKEKAFDPLPFKCQSTAVKAGVAVGAAAIAGIVIGGAAALGLAAFGGKKGYDAWKNMKQSKMAVSAENPLYSPNPNSSENPLYNG